MNKKATVSVIVPIYNSERFIGHCLNSILNQTYREIEIVIIDDGSTDGSFEIIDGYLKQHKCIKYFYQQNAGAGAARNNGITKATGRYLTFLDSDDRFSPDYIEKLVSKMESGAWLAVSGYTNLSAAGKVLSTHSIVDKPLSFLSNSATCGKMYDLRFIRENNIHFLENGKLFEDAYFFITAYSLSQKTVAADTVGYLIYENDASITHTAGKSVSVVDDVLKTLSKIKSDVSDNFSSPYFLSYFLYKSAVYCILFSCKGAEKSALYAKFDMLFDWIDKNTVIKGNPYFNPFNSCGERLTVKATVFLFRLLKELGLIKGFIYTFSKL